jgi:hypothetical protein
MTWTEDRAPVMTDPSVALGAEIEGRADTLKGTARHSLRDRHQCAKLSRPPAATQAAWSRTVFPYALPSRFQFTLNQDRSMYCNVARRMSKRYCETTISSMRTLVPPLNCGINAFRVCCTGCVWSIGASVSGCRRAECA